MRLGDLLFKLQTKKESDSEIEISASNQLALR